MENLDPCIGHTLTNPLYLNADDLPIMVSALTFSGFVVLLEWR